MSTSTDLRADLVSRALELRDEGRSDWLEQACGEHVELHREVRAAVDEALALPGLLVEGAAADRRVGVTLGDRYRLERRIGAGAMGVVYEAEDTELRRLVAVKVLRPGLMEEARAEKRFEREAQAMAKVAHPAVVAIHDRGQTDEDETFLVMDLVDGLPLSLIVERLAERYSKPTDIETSALFVETDGERSTIRVFVRWVLELCAGLRAAHDAGVLHRDIKPSNVILRRDGRPVLVDFGVAHLVGADPITTGDSGVGTPAYMPPESLAGERRVSPEGDVYGLAAVLYCLLTLRAPYDGSPVQVLFQLSTREPKPLARLHPGLPRDLIAIVEKGMERKESSRYASAEEFEADLSAFLDHRPVIARPIGPVRRLLRQARHSKAARGAMAVIVLLVITAVGMWGRSEYLAGRDAQYRPLYAQLPPNFTILRPENRTYIHESDRAALEQLLNDLVDVANDPLPSVLLRASFRFDHGDKDGAAEDMARIADHEGTALAQALADAYAEGSTADVETLPAPSTPRDRYLLAYERLRANSSPGDMLDEETCEAVAHAKELALAISAPRIRRLDEEERLQASFVLLEELYRFEERMGGQTAWSRQTLGYAFLHTHRFSESSDALNESIALAPRTHVNRVNMAAASLALGDLEAVRHHATVGLEVRPNDEPLLHWLYWSYIAEGEFDDAKAAVEQYGPFVSRQNAWYIQEHLGIAELHRALALWSARSEEWTLEELDPLREALSQARRSFEECMDLGAKTVPAHILLAFEELLQAEGLDELEPEELAATLAELEQGLEQELIRQLAIKAADDPRGNPWRLQYVFDHFPEHFEPAAADAVRQLLEATRRALPGANVSPRDQ